MGEPQNYIIRNFRDASPHKVGIKAWNLFLLKKIFPVPEFAIISTEAFDYYQVNKSMSPEIEREIQDLLESFFKNGAVAIRSSGIVEDLTSATFAGIYKTFLGIKTVKDGIHAIVNVWESVNSQSVKSYCKEMNIKSEPMAVIIQRQLNPEVSGVLITQSPYSVNEILIECCSGLGDKLLSGLITPSRYRIKKEEIIEQRRGNLINKDQAFHLARIGSDIEKIFQAPQEIEWAIENEKIYILQARPISAHIARPRRSCTVWCNVNVRETIPDPISPLMWSFFDKFLFPMIFLNVLGFPISREKFQRFPPIENLSGRLYWNINNTIAYGKVIGPLL